MTITTPKIQNLRRPSTFQNDLGIKSSDSRSLSICAYTDTFLPDVGGAEVVLDTLAAKLQDAGHSVVVLAPNTRTKGPHPNSIYRLSRYRRPVSKRFGVRLTLGRLIGLHARHRFDVIHCHAAYPQGYVASSFKKLFGVPYVIRPHGSDILAGERIRSNSRLEERLQQALRNADGIVAQGESLKETILRLGVDERRVHVIHNGVDLATFAQSSTPPYAKPYLLGLGNLSYRKGFDVLLKAYAKLEGPAADLVIAGSGREEATLKALCHQLGLGRRVHFPGHVAGAEKVSLYRGAQFFVCPSRREPFANVLLEALASGLPIVATAVGGNTELVRDRCHGLLCPADDVGALAGAMAMLLHDCDLRKRYGRAARQFVAPFDWRFIAAAYENLYRQVASESGIPSSMDHRR